LGYLALLIIIASLVSCFYFYQRTLTQRRQILLLSRQLDYLRTKSNKQSSTPSTVSIKYSEPGYKNGYTTENSVIYLSPLEDSPVVYKTSKAVKVSVLDIGEILNSKWYEISIPSVNGARIKGWVKESELKLMVDEATV
jgi:hypothetical protein